MLLAGLEASAVQIVRCHSSHRDRGFVIDGGQQLRIEQYLPYGLHYNATDSISQMVDLTLRNFRQATVLHGEWRQTAHPDRIAILAQDGPVNQTPVSLRVIGPDIAGTYHKFLDCSDLTMDDVALIDPTLPLMATTGAGAVAQPDYILAEYGAGVTNGRVSGHTLPSGVSIVDNTADGATIFSEADMKANSGIVRFSHTVSVGAMAVGAVANVDIPNVLPASGNGSYIITGGLTGTADPLAVAGLGWDVLPDGGTGVRLLLCNNASSGTRNPDGVWKFEARYQP